ncbi:hypothetical protein ACVW17_003044 [Bradyrhizobium sp. USDA 4473]
MSLLLPAGPDMRARLHGWVRRPIPTQTDSLLEGGGNCRHRMVCPVARIYRASGQASWIEELWTRSADPSFRGEASCPIGSSSLMSHSRLFSSIPAKRVATRPIRLAAAARRRSRRRTEDLLESPAPAALLWIARRMQPRRAFHMSAICALRGRSRVGRLCRCSSAYETTRSHQTLYCTNVSFRYRSVRRTIPTFAILFHSGLRRLTDIKRSAEIEDYWPGRVLCPEVNGAGALLKYDIDAQASLCVAWRHSDEYVDLHLSSAGHGETTRI